MEKKSMRSRLASSEAFLSVAASLLSIVIGLALGTIVLAIILGVLMILTGKINRKEDAIR